MYAVEKYAAVRHFVFVEGKSRREAARFFGLSRDTVARMCRYSAPPGYTRKSPPAKPKLGPLLPVIDAVLEADKSRTQQNAGPRAGAWRIHRAAREHHRTWTERYGQEPYSAGSRTGRASGRDVMIV